MSVYAVADLHGQLDLWNQISDYLKKDDIIYVLGDCGDRGPHPWETIKAVFQDSRAIYLKGNHEDMLVKAMRESKYEGIFYEDTYLLFSNGGEQTLVQWINEGSKIGWANYLEKLPISKTYINEYGEKIILSHAGYTPSADFSPNQKDLIWDRAHIYDDWFGEDNEIIVHGHTPHTHLWHRIGAPKDNMPQDGKAFWYCDKHKVCIDAGACVTNKTVLLNLDTFEEKMFTIRKDNDNE